MIQTDVLNCGTGNVGTYFDGCKLTTRDIVKPFLLSPMAKINLQTDTFDEAARAELIKKGLLVPLNDLLQMTEAGAKPNIQTLPNKIEIFISDGLYKFSFEFEANVCLVKSTRRLAKKKWQLLLLDSEDKLFFDNKGGMLQGFDINSFVVGNETPNDGGSKVALFMVDMQLSQDGTRGYNERRSFLVDDTLIDCNGVEDVKLATVDPAHAAWVVSVLAGCDGSTPILGLTAANFKMVKASDASIVTPTSVTDNNDGTYTIVSTATATDYTLQLFDSVNNSTITDIDGLQFYQSNVLAETLV